MSFEKQGHESGKTRRDFLEGAFLGVSTLPGAVAGGYLALTEALDRVNAHVLSPAMIDALKRASGGTDEDIVKLEEKAKPMLLDELRRIMNEH